MSYYPNPYGLTNPFATISAAGNVPLLDNPTYTAEMFYIVYPAFKGKISDELLAMFISMAMVSVNQARWGEEWWPFGMANFIAHWVTLNMEASQNPTCSAAGIIANARAQGLVASKTVGNLSISYDFSQVDFNGWPMYKTTTYGRQFASIARLLGMGGMYIW